MREQNNNKVAVIGTVVEKFAFDHMAHSEAFYRVKLAVTRMSGQVDMIPCMISERLVDVTEDISGKVLKVSGQFRSFNQLDGEKKRLILFVFAQEVEFQKEPEESTTNNSVFLDGFLCKAPGYRKTPLGREICDLLVAVNRPFGQTDYIPTIVWGRLAAHAGRLNVGTHIQLWGRAQSREYTKILSETESITRTAYELSANKFTVVEDQDE